MAIGLSQIQTVFLDKKAGTGLETNRLGLTANAGKVSSLTRDVVQALYA